MDPSTPGQMFSEGMIIIFSTGWPLFGTLFVVGLIMGVFQAATQINDAAVGFVPRITAGMIVIWILGNWMVDKLSKFLLLMLEQSSGTVM